MKFTSTIAVAILAYCQIVTALNGDGSTPPPTTDAAVPPQPHHHHPHPGAPNPNHLTARDYPTQLEARDYAEQLIAREPKTSAAKKAKNAEDKRLKDAAAAQGGQHVPPTPAHDTTHAVVPAHDATHAVVPAPAIAHDAVPAPVKKPGAAHSIGKFAGQVGAGAMAGFAGQGQGQGDSVKRDLEQLAARTNDPPAPGSPEHHQDHHGNGHHNGPHHGPHNSAHQQGPPPPGSDNTPPTAPPTVGKRALAFSA